MGTVCATAITISYRLARIEDSLPKREGDVQRGSQGNRHRPEIDENSQCCSTWVNRKETGVRHLRPHDEALTRLVEKREGLEKGERKRSQMQGDVWTYSSPYFIDSNLMRLGVMLKPNCLRAASSSCPSIVPDWSLSKFLKTPCQSFQ